MQPEKARKELERRAAARLELRDRALSQKTVYAIVAPDKTISKLIQRNDAGEFVEVHGKLATVQIPLKLEPVLTRPKKYIVIYGGRGGAKSISIMDILGAETKDDGSKTMCFREIQKSIQESVYTGLEGEIGRLGLPGFTMVNNEIRHTNGGLFSFWGLKASLGNMKSLYGYKRFWTEEAEITSQKSLDVMGPTLRGVDGASLIFTFNPRSSADPIYQAFIKPYERQLNRDGIYEDDYHLIIKVGYEDNPWFQDDETLRMELEKDRDKVLKRFMTQAKFDHIWCGATNDSVENAIISTDWFDAAIDAHKKLGFEPEGARISTHDPSDEGDDAKGYALRQGSVVLRVAEKDDGDINDGCDWATDLAISDRADVYRWDCDGMGVGLKRDTARAFNGLRVDYEQFYGSRSGKGMDDAETIYEPVEDTGKQPKKVKETFRNNRSYYYWRLRDRFYNTYRAVMRGEYIDPDTMISLDSEGIENMAQLRAEVCRIPLHKNPNGFIQIMSKDDMKRIYEIDSPNLGDCLMMLMGAPPVVKEAQIPVTIPRMNANARSFNARP